MDDFNCDGSQDLVINGSSISVVLGNGDGTFQPAVSFFVGGDSHSIAVGQLSGDVRPDIAVAGSHTFGISPRHKVSVLINDTPW